MASGQIPLGLSLRDRLPKVAALFTAGKISSRLVAVIAWRTYPVRDEKALHLIDTALAERVIAWGPLSSQKLEDAIDLWIDRYDPGALRRNRIVTARHAAPSPCPGPRSQDQRSSPAHVPGALALG